MDRKSSHLTALPPLLAHAAASHAAFLLFVFPQETFSDHAGMLIWWSCLLLAYTVLNLYLRRPRNMRGVLIISAVSMSMQLALTLCWGKLPHSFAGWLVLLPLWGYSYYRCCMTVLRGPTPEGLLATFELNAVMLLLTAVCSGWNVMGRGNLYHLLLGLLLSLAALARLRRGHRRVSSARRGNGLVFAALAVIGSVSGAFCLLVTGNANQLLTRFTAWALAAWSSALDRIGQIIYWFLTLLPQFEKDVTGTEPEEVLDFSYTGTEEVFRETDILIAVLLLAAAAVAVWLLVRLWRSRTRHQVNVMSRPVRQVTRIGRSLTEILRELLGRMTRWLRFRRQYLSSRGTPVGLLVWLEFRMAARRKPRQPGETPRMFLMRVGTLLPDCAAELNTLADCLDRHYFGSGDSLTKDEVTHMRRKLSRAFAARSQNRQ